MPLLEVVDLSAFYGAFQALWGVSLRVVEGEIVSVVGANAAGKTTLLRSISGVEARAVGTVRLQGQSLDGVPSHRRVAMGVVHVPEGRRLFPEMTVLENLLMGGFSAREQRAERLAQVLDRLPVLAERRRQLAGSLSGGEQQMVAIGRGLMANPRLLMLDEPSLGLAPIMTARIFDLLRGLNADGVTILLVEQNVEHALRLSHRGYVLESGRVVLEGTGPGLVGHPDLRRAYMGV